MALGLRFPGPHAAIPSGLAGSTLLAIAILLAVASRRSGEVRGRSGRLVAVALGAVLAAGALVGASAAWRASASCVHAIPSGGGVTVRGVTRESARAGSSVRLTLLDNSIFHIDRRRGCFVRRLVVRVTTLRELQPAGSPVVVRGEWIRLGRPSAWPRRPGRVGIVVGKLDASGGDWATSRAALSGPASLALNRARSHASGRLRRLLPDDVSPIARALVLAERDDLPGDIRTRFVEAGLAHLLAISGLHVGLIGGTAALLLASFLGPVRAAIGSAVIIAAYVCVIGAPPSAVRASLLLCGWALARARGVPARPWDLLGAAAMVALIADPLVLAEPGFQLSFAGFGGLGAGATAWPTVSPRLSERIPTGMASVFRRLRRANLRLDSVGVALAGGTGAFLATAPIAAAHFQHVAPAALVSHLAGAPLAGAAIGALAMTMVLPPPFDSLGAAAAATVIRMMVATATWISELPGAHFVARGPAPLTWGAIMLFLAGLWRFLRWGRARSAVLPVAASAALVLAAPVLTSRLPAGRSLICTLDVGQGDAAVIRTGRGRWILVDAGPRFGQRDAGRDVVLPLLRRFGARRIDLFVLSHPDLDHMGGFDAIHEAVPVFRVLDSGHPIPKQSYARFLARSEEDGIRWLPAASGDVVHLDNVTVRVLGPSAPVAPEAPRGPANETSLLLRVSIGRALVYLNTGDATAADERALLAAWGPDSARADLLKVGHHGSRTSTGTEFLEAVRPSIAVISAGRGNAYGHPHDIVLNRLNQAAVPRVWRTDRDGTLCIEADDTKGWRVRGRGPWKPSSGMARVLTSQRSVE